MCRKDKESREEHFLDESVKEKESIIEQLKKYEKPMDRMYYIMLTVNLLFCTLSKTPILQSGVGVMENQAQGMEENLFLLILRLILNLRLLIVVPAIYGIVVLMKERREKIIAAVFLILGWFYSFYMREWNEVYIFTAMALIVASYGKDFRKIGRLTMIIVGGVVTLTVILCFAGVLLDYYQIRDGRIRHSFGMFAPTATAGCVCSVLMIMIFLRNGELRWFEYLIIVVLSALNLLFVDGRVAFLSIALATGGCVYLAVYRKIGYRWPDAVVKVFRGLLCCSFLLVAGWFLLAVFTYKAGGDAFYQRYSFLSSLHSRIEVPHRLLGRLSLSVFGNYLFTYEYSEHILLKSDEYLFLDSAYARMLLSYGVVGLVLCLYVFTHIQRRLLKENRIFQMYLMSIMAVFFMIQRGIYEPESNIFMTLFWAVITNNKEMEQARVGTANAGKGGEGR